MYIKWDYVGHVASQQNNNIINRDHGKEGGGREKEGEQSHTDVMILK